VAHSRARSRAVPSASPADSPPPREAEPAGEAASIPALLARATEEAASLLAADGAFLYLVDPASGRLRLTHDAGVRGLGRRPWFRRLELPMGVGMFGRSVAERRVLVTGDYQADESFVHSTAPDRIVGELEIRSLVVAPLAAGGEVFGALGTFTRQPDAFAAPQIALVRALADHAAMSMANAQLIAQLAHSRVALERRAVVERSLRELGTRISGARDPAAVVQFTIDEALRLLHGDGSRIDIVDPQAGQLRGLFSSGDEQILETEWPRDPDDRLEVGASGRAVITGETYVTGDYLADETIVHSIGPDTYVRSKGIRAVIATPLNGDQGPFGAITVWSTRPDAFGPEDAALLETIAGQSAVALGRARLIEELGRSREMLARRAAPGCRRRGGPPARLVGRGDRPAGPGDGRGALGARCRHR
jgi:GAF domain-containing protein